ncbi:MAG: DNA polymerase III subunit alpha [Clostridia bacterium]|nr:DNA polymerase III subunit alpha [Clostridia bacterium]
MTDFTHLHLHTEYSLLDGACRVGEVVSLAKKLGQKSIAVTDHGVLYGAVAFYKACKAEGIKPIIGCEVYVAPRSRFDKVHGIDSARYHLILLCKNETGYKNLLKLVSAAWVDGFYTKPRVDRELLEKYHEGLVALSGCLFGEVAQKIVQRNPDEAEAAAVWYSKVFGEGNYYLEVQNHGMIEEREVLEGVVDISRKHDIPIVATNDVHYCYKSDADIQRVLIAIQTNKVVGEQNALEFSNDEFYLKSGDEMAETFADYPEAIANTQTIADKCNFDFEFGVTKLPLFDAPVDNHQLYLKSECIKGLEDIMGTIPESYHKRLDYELSVINEMGFNDYFLIVADFIRFAKSKDIPVGPGRGSAAGSLAAYALGITGIDPIENKLLFERFLNPERVSMPDIDIDFCYERRGEVIDYVTEKYGTDRVAQIVTFGTLQAKAAVRDVARALGLPYSTGDIVAKQISRDYHDINDALAKNNDLKNLYDSDENIKKIIDTAARLEGMPRHASTHAAGVVITREEVSSYVPLAKNGDQTVTQFTMTEIEQLGLLKMDFLGLRTLTVINDTVEEVRKTEPRFDISRIPLDYKDVFTQMSAGNTVGVFQCESAGMTNLIVNMKPERFSDIAAAIALYRPGPMFFIDTYLDNRKNSDHITYRTPLLKDILDETNGCMVYQEQVMQVFRTLAGYSYGRADVVRRAMSKKKRDVMESERNIFIHGLTDEKGNIIIEGAVRKGIDEKTANDVFSDMISFASYGFNKSHTAAYGLVAYRTAYLKVKYPCAFMAALLTSVIGDVSKTVIYINECARLSINVLSPHVNRSGNRFSVEGKDIVFPLLGIKNLGRALIDKIVAERKNGGNFKSYWDFCKRISGTELNRRALECLIKAGALDGLGMNRCEMLRNLDLAMESAAKESAMYAGGQLDMFSVFGGDDYSSEPVFTKCDELPKNELLNFEKDVAGLYFSGHPLEEYRSVSESLKCPKTSELYDYLESGREGAIDNRKVQFIGIINSVKKKVTKRDDIMAFCGVEDLYGDMEMIIFPKVLTEFAPVLTVGRIVLIEGRISVKDDEIKILAEKISEAPKTADNIIPVTPKEKTNVNENSKQRKGLFLRLSTKDETLLTQIQNLVSIFEGGTPVYLYYEDLKQYEFLGKEFLTSVNEPMLCELKRKIGDKNVVLRQ